MGNLNFAAKSDGGPPSDLDWFGGAPVPDYDAARAAIRDMTVYDTPDPDKTRAAYNQPSIMHTPLLPPYISAPQTMALRAKSRDQFSNNGVQKTDLFRRVPHMAAEVAPSGEVVVVVVVGESAGRAGTAVAPRTRTDASKG